MQSLVFFKKNFFFFFFLAALGLRCCARAFSSCRERGLLFIVVRGLRNEVASLVADHGLQARRLSSCGSRAQLLRGMWDIPGPGLEPVSPALAGGFLTTVPPGKPQCYKTEEEGDLTTEEKRQCDHRGRDWGNADRNQGRAEAGRGKEQIPA